MSLTLSYVMSHIPPPRLRRVLKRKPVRVPLNTHRVRYTSFIPAAVSLPHVMPPWPFSARQWRITTFSVGLPTRMPSSALPLFSVKQSSPQFSVEYSISTFLHDDMSMPSPLGTPTEFTVTPRIITFSQYMGLMFHKTLRSNVTPSTSTLRQFIGANDLGR